MCGIFAALSPEQAIWSPDDFRTATDQLRHRGPDAGAYWHTDHVFLGHRRLSIIDLSTGDQPMLSHDARFVIVFNGEIYNYRELRAELRRSGHTFVTQSDTEAILEAYRRWGGDCVRHLNGMFAFALWDRQENLLFAARDRLGIKPLCWTLHQGTLLLASTLEPLLRLPDLPRRLDYTALRDVLAFDYIAAPRTMIANIQKLRPGHRLWMPLDKTAEPQIDCYWDVPVPQPETEIDRTELIDEVEALLEQAVARQMVSDVPLGAFLSGGIDSSLMVAMMARHSTRPVKTFSVSFRAQGFDESHIAQAVATELGTDHMVLQAEEASGDDVRTTLGRLDEPFADTALIPTHIVSALARQHVTVALSGDGGDEVFGGYEKYLFAEDARNGNGWRRFTRPLKHLIEQLPGRPPGTAGLYYQTLNPRERVRFAWARYGDFPVFRKDMQLVLAPDTHAQVDVPAFFETWEAHARRWGDRYTMDLLMRTDLRTYLSENCLVKTDRASMMPSLEVRVPYLDELILERILPLPADVKIKDGQLKSLLVPLAQRLLPRAVWDRPKQGFGVPTASYLAGPWHGLLDEMLDWGEHHAPIFNYRNLRQLVALNDLRQTTDRDLWNPLVVLVWLQAHRHEVAL